MATMDERIKEARISMAKTAIGSPYVYPHFNRLKTAKENLEKAKAEFADAKKAWDKLIEPAPPEWKKLAPRV